MINLKNLYLAAAFGVSLASCNNQPTDVPLTSVQTELKQPLTAPIKFDQEKKISLSGSKPVAIHPVVEKFDMDKLPARLYDPFSFKPFSYPIAEARFDYNSLPQKDLDIDKLPSKPLRFDTYILPPPKLIKAGLPRLKNDNNPFLFELGEAQGLPGAEVSCVLTDRDGFLWIATSQGIYRYDGENLALYVPGPIEHYIFNMVQDTDGRIWMSTQIGGLQILDPKSGILKIILKKHGLGDNNLVRLLLDDRQRIWVTTFGGGVNIIDFEKQTIKTLDKTNGFSDISAIGITQDINHNIWIATPETGVDVIDLKNNKIKYMRAAQGLNTDTLTSAICDSKGRIWVSAFVGGAMNVIDPGKGSIQYIRETESPNVYIWAMMPDKRGLVWVGTSTKGVQIIDLDKKTIENIHTTGGVSGDLGDFIENMSQDNRGQTWIATKNGLNLLRSGATLVQHIGKEAVSCITTDRQGLIWQGTFSNGVYILDRKTGTSRHFTTKQGLVNDSIGFMEEAGNFIFINSAKGGLNIIDPSRKSMQRFSKTQLAFIYVPAAIFDKTGKIWLGSKGIDIFDPKKGTISHLGEEAGINDYVIDIIPTDHDNIWVSTAYNGILLVNTKTQTIKHLSNAPGTDFQSGLGGTYKEMLKDDGGNIWLGTYRGIYIVNLEKNTITSFSTPQGLLDEDVLSLSMHNNRIYAATDKGITVITPPMSDHNKKTKWKTESFGKEYGIIRKVSGQFKTATITDDGIYCWGDEGVTLLDLTKKDQFIPPSYVTGMNVMDEPRYFADQSKPGIRKTDTVRGFNNEAVYSRGRLPENTGYTSQDVDGPFNAPVSLQLPYNQNYVQFNFASLDLVKHDSTWCRYILDGVDKKWSRPVTSTSSRNYFNLAPGSYTFKVVSRGFNGLWSKPAQLSFIITPPWWQTWWAYLLYVCLFAGTVWGFVYYRSRQLIKEKRILEHKVHIRTEEVLQQKEEIEAQRDGLEKAFSELKLTQTQLIQSEKMASLGELTAGIAHEIQNPLNFVNNFSEVNTDMIGELEGELKCGNIDEALSIAADIKDNEQKINHHGKRADAIVKAMLQHSRSSSGQRELININALADEYLRLAYHGLRAKDKSFNAITETHFDKTIAEININPQDIGRVILNLLNNAFYAVNEKKKLCPGDYEPTVTVTTKVISSPLLGGRGTELSVRDNGNGIPQKIIDKIYQPFFTTKPTGQGTGLGLSMSYDIIKAHGGELRVETVEGEFTEFIMVLPV